jgi:hypothetical protein
MDTLHLLAFGHTLQATCRIFGADLWHLLLIFVTRHWALALVNSGVTVVLGLALLRLIPRPFVLRPTPQGGLRGFLFRDCDLRLRRFLFVAVLCKGAFYLVLGDGHRPSRHHAHPLMWGFQIPDPREVLRLMPQTLYTIWRPTAATEQVGLLLGGLAFVLLLRRASQVAALMSCLKALTVVSHRKSEDRAGTALNFPTRARLPRILLADVPVPTPLLLGLARPYILLAPSLAAAFSEAELEAALRHELAHYRHHDHWWRWALLWVGDLGRINPLSGWLGECAVDTEEDICDRWAIRSPRDAAALVRALAKSEAHHLAPLHPLDHPGMADAVSATATLPHLLGRTRFNHVNSLDRRLQGLLKLVNIASSETASGSAKSAVRRPPQPHIPQETRPSSSPARFNGIASTRRLAFECWTLLVVALLFAVIYTKYFFLVIVQ